MNADTYSDGPRQLLQSVQELLPDACLQPTNVPLAPAIQLYLLNRDYPRTGLASERLMAIMEEPLYWLFCWAAGQVLAKQIMTRPELVAGKRVLDFGSGSGVVAIAAARAGAAEVIACDNDPLAREACQLNAQLNQVVLCRCADYHQVTGPIDLIIAADVLYDRANLRWLTEFVSRSPEVLVADSRIKQFRVPPYRLVGQQRARTFPDLEEDDEVCQVNIYRAG